MMYDAMQAPEWKQENIDPFNELMLSWNAPRPRTGNYSFYVRVKVDAWSPWLLYALWGSDGQKGAMSNSSDSLARVYQDAVEILESKKATGYQIKIEGEKEASIESIHGLYVYTNSDQTPEVSSMIYYSLPVRLPLKGLSQMSVEHTRCKDFCSPTSTTAVTRYLSKNEKIDPVSFADSVWDGTFDIYGNWVLNVAHAASLLGPKWSCWVERLDGFDPIYENLHRALPVVVSVQGPLQGSALPYKGGHLLVVIGYDPETKKVLCMDPAFPQDLETEVSYDFADFMQAWERRGRIAYMFSPA